MLVIHMEPVTKKNKSNSFSLCSIIYIKSITSETISFYTVLVQQQETLGRTSREAGQRGVAAFVTTYRLKKHSTGWFRFHKKGAGTRGRCGARLVPKLVKMRE